MFKTNRTLRIVVVFILAISLFASQIAYADMTNEKGDIAVKQEYKTLVAKYGDYVEKGGVQNAEVTLLRNDALSISDPQGTFIEFLITNGQEVKKGDPLVSYQVPGDSIGLEEKKLMLEKNQNDYQKESEKREADIAANQKRLETMDVNSIEAQILKLTIRKMQNGYDQYIYQSMKSLDELKSQITDLESVLLEPQYVYAPYDGIVYINDKIKAGIALNQGTQLVYIADTGSAVISAQASGANKLWYNLKASVIGINNKQVDTSKTYNGEIIATDSLFNGKANTGMVYIKLEDETTPLTPRQKVNITADAVIVKNVLTIPLSVVKSNGDMRYVYILDDNKELRKQYISGRDNGTDMWVYNGLSEGQQIVIE